MAEVRDYASIAFGYATDIVAGAIAACAWTIKACQRQLDDLGRQQTPGFPFRYEPARGARVCRMMELLPHIKGRWRSPLIKLEPWQIFIVMTVFSWVFATAAAAEPEVREKDGLRRFHTVYIEVPRKNAKSTLTAGVGLYMLAPDGEQGAECYSAATTKDQARIVFDVARAMARKTPAFCTRFGVEIGTHALTAPDTESLFKALSAEDNSLDGLNPHFAGIDELHAHKTRGVYDVLETATGARTQALLWTITTAGTNRAGICYEVRTYLTKLLDRSAVDETFFGVIYSIDDGDDWTDPSVWKKANPNYGVSVFPDDIARLCRKAQELPSAQPNFLTKRLNVWVNADSPWLDMRKWDRCADTKLSIDTFAGQECFVGIVMATPADVAGVVYVFPKSEVEAAKASTPPVDPIADDGADAEPAKPVSRTHYYLFAKFYVPEDTIEESSNSQYAGWARSGKIIGTDGNTTDQNLIQDDLRVDKSIYEFREVAYDPFQANKFAAELLEEGFPMVELGSTVKNFSAPMKELEAAILSGRLHHTGDPVMTWMMSNVVSHVDKKENVFPTRQTSLSKIDGPVAAIRAFARAMHAPPPETSIYEQGGITFA